jgi:hypothetical protein
VLDVVGRCFRFNFSTLARVDNLDKNIRGLFLLILHKDIGG